MYAALIPKLNFCDCLILYTCTDDKYRVRLEPRMDSMDPADYINASFLDVSFIIIRAY